MEFTTEPTRSFSVTSFDDGKSGKKETLSNFGQIIRTIFAGIPLFSSVSGRGTGLGRGQFPIVDTI